MPNQPHLETKGEMTRTKLRKAATRTFARFGYEATRVSDIVNEADVSQPTFYIYFDSKEAAYESLVEEFREKLRLTTLSNLIEASTPRSKFIDRVALSFRRFLDLMAEDKALTEIGFFQPPSCTVTKAKMVNWVADNIAREQADALFRKDIDPEFIARLLVGILEQFGRIQISAKDRQNIADICAQLFCSGAGLPEK